MHSRVPHCVSSTLFRLDQERRSSVLRLPVDNGVALLEMLERILGEVAQDFVVHIETPPDPYRITATDKNLDR